jgi:RNA polymerase sigma-70 factor (ECF subfamily)
MTGLSANARTLADPNFLMESAAPSECSVLTAAMARGDEDAYRWFLDRYLNRLLRYHLVVARGDEQSARDALQETLARVARHVRRFEDEAVLWSWLTRVGRTAAVDGARQRHRYWLMLDRVRELWRPAGSTEESEETSARFHRALDRCLDGLEPADRALVEARYFRRASHQELATETATSLRSVESRLARLRREMRTRLLSLLDDENGP